MALKRTTFETSFARLDLLRTLPSARSGYSDAARSNSGSGSFYAAVISEAPHSPATGTRRLETAPVANEIVADDEQLKREPLRTMSAGD